MNRLYMLDSYAWIEYFNGSLKGLKVKKLLEGEMNSFFTLESSLSELYSWCLKQKRDFKEIFNLISSYSVLQPIMLQDWLDAALIRNDKKKGVGILDCLMFAKQSALKCFVVTGDQHFKDSKNVMFI